MSIKKNSSIKLLIVSLLLFVLYSFMVPTKAEAACAAYSDVDRMDLIYLDYPPRSSATQKISVTGESVYNASHMYVAPSNKTIKISGIDTNKSINMDVAAITSWVLNVKNSSANCFLSDSKAKSLNFKDAKSLYSHYEKEFKNIAAAYQEEIQFGYSLKKFISQQDIPLADARLSLSQEEQKIVKEAMKSGLKFTTDNPSAEEYKSYTAIKKFLQNYINTMRTRDIEAFENFLLSSNSPFTGGRKHIAFTTVDDYQILMFSKNDDWSTKISPDPKKYLRNLKRDLGRDANGGIGRPGVTPGQLIAAPGMFTSGFFLVDATNCDDLIAQGKDIRNGDFGKNIEESASNGSATSLDENTHKTEQGPTKVLKGPLDDSIGGFTASPQENSDGSLAYKDDTLMGLNCSQVGVVSFLTHLYKPVNITTQAFVMDIIFTFQVIALGVAVLLMSVFGLFYAAGNEATDPFKFLIRGFVVMLVVFYFPYFIQDILNVNNMIVYFIQYSHVDIWNTQTTTAMGALWAAVAVNVIIANLALIFTTGGAWLFVLAIVLLVVIVFFVKAIVTLLVWWYARFLMILFLAALGPLFMVMMILPKTARYGHLWLKSFISEVMTQSVMVIGFWFAGKVLENFGEIGKTYNMSLIGYTVLLYCLILLCSRLPEFSQMIFGRGLNGVVGYQDAKRVGEAVGEFVNNGTMAALSGLQNKMRAKEGEKLNSEMKGLEKAYETAGTDKRAELDNKMEKLREKMKNNETRQKKMAAFEKSFKSGKLVDDGSYKEALEKDTGLDGKQQNKLTDEYKDKLKAADENAIQSNIDKANQKHENALKVAEGDYREELEKIQNNDKLDENAKEERREKALNKLNAAKEKAEATKEKDIKNAMHGMDASKTVSDVSQKLKNEAADKLNEGIRKSLGKGDYQSEIEKSLHASSIAAGIRGQVEEELENEKQQQGNETQQEVATNLDNETSELASMFEPNESFNEINPVVSKLQQEHPGINKEAVNEYANELNASTNKQENALLDTAEVLERKGQNDGTLLENGKFADGKTPLDKAGEVLQAYGTVQTLQGKGNLNPAEQGKLKQAQAVMQNFAEEGNYTDDEFQQINRNMKDSYDASLEQETAAADFLQNSGLSEKDAMKANDVLSDYAGSNVQGVIQKSQSMPMVSQANNAAQFMPEVVRQSEYVSDTSTGYQVNGVSEGYANIQSTEQLKGMQQSSYAQTQQVRMVSLMSEGYSEREASGIVSDTMPSFAEYTQGPNIGNMPSEQGVVANHVLQIAKGDMSYAIGKHHTQNGFEVELDYDTEQMKGTEQTYGEGVSKSAFESLKSMSASTRVAAQFGKINQINEMKLQDSIDSGAISYDEKSGHIKGEAFDNHIEIVKNDLMNNSGLSKESASVVAEQYVRTAVSSGNANLSGQLPEQTTSVIVTELLRGEMSRGEIKDNIDMITGYDKDVSQMVESYITELETNLGGKWDTIKGNVPSSFQDSMGANYTYSLAPKTSNNSKSNQVVTEKTQTTKSRRPTNLDYETNKPSVKGGKNEGNTKPKPQSNADSKSRSKNRDKEKE